MVLASANLKFRLGSLAVVLAFYFCILTLCGLKLHLQEKAFVLILTWEN